MVSAYGANLKRGSYDVTRYTEASMGIDQVTKRQVGSEGLLQLQGSSHSGADEHNPILQEVLISIFFKIGDKDCRFGLEEFTETGLRWFQADLLS